jgi:hypothetical protein
MTLLKTEALHGLFSMFKHWVWLCGPQDINPEKLNLKLFQTSGAGQC